eukprot:gene10646-biopygen6295
MEPDWPSEHAKTRDFQSGRVPTHPLWEWVQTPAAGSHRGSTAQRRRNRTPGDSGGLCVGRLRAAAPACKSPGARGAAGARAAGAAARHVAAGAFGALGAQRPPGHPGSCCKCYEPPGKLHIQAVAHQRGTGFTVASRTALHGPLTVVRRTLGRCMDRRSDACFTLFHRMPLQIRPLTVAH